MSRFDLPEGRGVRKGVDSWVEQSEAYRQRRQLIPEQNGDFLSTLPIYAPTTGVSGTANTLHLYYVGRLDREYVFETARINCTTSVASSTVRVGVYRLRDERPYRLLKVTNSEAQFQSTSTGMLESTFQNPIRLVKGAQYFFGLKASSGTIAASGTSGPDMTVQTLTIAGTDMSFPAEVRIEDVTKDATALVFAITYLSQQMADII